MDIENLIEQLNRYFEGETLPRGTALDAATALSTLQAENEKLRSEAEGMRSNWYKSVEEIQKLRGENIRWGQVASEQDKAIDNLRKEPEWKDMVIELAQRKQQEAEAALKAREQE